MAKSMIHVEERGVPCSLEPAREAVSEIHGVYGCEANHITHTLTVEYDQDQVILDQIRIAIKKGQPSSATPNRVSLSDD